MDPYQWAVLPVSCKQMTGADIEISRADICTVDMPYQGVRIFTRETYKGVDSRMYPFARTQCASLCQTKVTTYIIATTQ